MLAKAQAAEIKDISVSKRNRNKFPISFIVSIRLIGL